MRSVRIDDRERPALSIEVAGRTFLVRRVVTGVRQRWGEFMQLQGTALEKIGELQKKLATTDDDKGATDELQRELDHMDGYSQRIAQEREKAESDCIRLILEKNAYEFDWPWWINETDSIDRQSFIVEALNKDVFGGGKKKAVK